MQTLRTSSCTFLGDLAGTSRPRRCLRLGLLHLCPSFLDVYLNINYFRHVRVSRTYSFTVKYTTTPSLREYATVRQSICPYVCSKTRRELVKTLSITQGNQDKGMFERVLAGSLAQGYRVMRVLMVGRENGNCPVLSV